MSVTDEITTRYPLGEKQPERLKSRTGRRFDEITLEAVREGQVRSDDLTIDAETLRMQADLAAAAGHRQLAANLRRAAELVEIPNERLLQIYEALRPKRSTYRELKALGEELEIKYGAVENGRFIREAAEAYQEAGLLRSESEVE